MSSLILIVVAVVVVLAIVAAIAMTRRPRLKPLSDVSRARYSDAWRNVETLFVDEPRRAVSEADALVVTILRERGRHIDGGSTPPELRGARELARGDEAQDGERRGLGQTESLRRAMVAYQRVVDDAVGQSTRTAAEARRREVIS